MPNPLRTLPSHLLVAVLAAGLACQPEPGPDPTVLVAADDLPAGAVLDEASLARVQASAARVGPGALAGGLAQTLIGRRLRVALQKGDCLSETALAPLGAAASVEEALHSRLRAVTLAAAGADHVQVGDRVDVLYQATEPSTREPLALTLTQDVPVLAVGATSAPAAGTPFALRQVTLELLPEEAEALALAEDTGLLLLALRNREDRERAEERGRATMNGLFTGERMKALQTLRYRTIQIIRGTESKGGGSSLGRAGGGSPETQAAAAPQPLMDRAVKAPRLGKVVYRDEKGEFQPLPIRALRVVVHVEGPRARTVVDAVIENPHDRILEGQLRYPLPQDASPAYFGTFQGAPTLDPLVPRPAKTTLPPLPSDAATARLDAVAPGASEKTRDGRWQEFRAARVVARAQAAQTYERVVRQRIDPALLEWAGGNDFEARIYPIGPRSLKRVVFVYEQTLSWDGTFAHYAFPLPEVAIPEAEARLYVDAGKASVAALSFGGEDRASAFEAGRGPFQAASLDLSGKAFKHDLRLALAPKTPRTQVLVGGGDAALPGSFVYGRLVADVPQATESAPTGDAIFVVDTSLSEEGDRARLAGQVLEAVLREDATIRRFNVLLFDVRARWLRPAGLADNTPAAREEALRELTHLAREGATSLEAAVGLLESTPWLPAGATGFLLSDGKVTWGRTAISALLSGAPRTSSLKWIAYRFGDAAVNRDLFDALTRRGGQVVTCLAVGQVPTAARAHRRPMMKVGSVRVAGAPLHDFVVRGSPQALAPGQEIEFAGRALGEPGRSGEVVVEGTLDGAPLTLRFPFEVEGRDMLAARAWAELHAERLLALQSPKLDRLVVALSQHFGLTNRVASLLVLETDAEYERYDLAKEAVGVAEVEAAAKDALARSQATEEGLDLTGLAPGVRALLALLGNAPKADPLAAAALLPEAGGEPRALAEAAFRARRKKAPDDLLAFQRVAQARRAAGDALGAVRAVSSIVELRPEDPESLRLAGFTLLAQGLPQAAAELFGHLRALRSFEVQVYLEEALALLEAGRLADAARNYEIALSQRFDRHDQVVEAGRVHYAQALRRALGGGRLGEPLRAAIAARLAELEPGPGSKRLDLQVTLHWSVDDIDIDLWATGPDGERCWYQHRETRSGGRLFWDETGGYGPELFHQPRALPGTYRVQVHYYGNNGEQWAVPAAVLGVLDRSPNDPKRHRRTFTVALLTAQGEAEHGIFSASFP